MKSASGTNPSKDPLLDSVVGNCKILKKLGQGGMGDVYLGEHGHLRKRVALKILPPDFGRNRDLVIRFRREAQAAARLEHPNIVQVHDVDEQNGMHYMVMQFVDGKSLQVFIDQQAPLDPKTSARIVRDVASALAMAHQHSIIHRDIKPGNILINKQKQVKLTDFGLAHDADSGSVITVSGAVLGTPHFLSPEQAEGKKTDGRSDIYSLGVTLYYMVTGHRPFLGESSMSILYKHVNEEPQDPRELNPAIPPFLGTVISKMMAKVPDNRYQNCNELILDLEKFIKGEYPKTGVTGVQTPIKRLPRKVPDRLKTTSSGERDMPTPKTAIASSKSKAGGKPPTVRRKVERKARSSSPKDPPTPKPPTKRKNQKTVLIASFSVIGLSIVGLIFAIIMASPGDSGEKPDPGTTDGTTQKPPEKKDQKFKDLVNRAFRHASNGELDKALSLFEEASALKPSDKDILTQIERLKFRIVKKTDDDEFAKAMAAPEHIRKKALEAYLADRPNGIHAQEARDELASMEGPPVPRAVTGNPTFKAYGGAKFFDHFSGCGHIKDGSRIDGDTYTLDLTSDVSDGAGHLIASKLMDVTDFEFRAEIRLERGWIMVIARWLDRDDLSEPDRGTSFRDRIENLDADKWYRLRVVVRNGRIQLILNDATVHTSALPQNINRYGRFGFSTPAGIKFHMRKSELKVDTAMDLKALEKYLQDK